MATTRREDTRILRHKWLWVSIRYYDELYPTWDVRCLSSCRDRFAFDTPWFSLIVELWFIQRPFEEEDDD